MAGVPRISVVTPTKNRLGLLCEAMDSVREQTLADWEHIVVDDGPDGGTAQEVLRRSQLDARVRYVRRSGGKSGANACRNLGFHESRAGLVVFLDSDDLLRANCLQRRVEVMDRNRDLDFSVYLAGVFEKTVGDLKRLYHPQGPGDNLLRFLAGECPWQTSGPVWRREFLSRIGEFDEALLSMQDLEMHVRALCAGGRYACFPEIDHDIRWQPDESKTSVRHFRDPVYIKAAEQIPAKLLRTVGKSGQLTWTRQRALAGLAFGVAESWSRSGSPGAALQAWNRSCREQREPLYLQFAGCVMLFGACLGTRDGGFFSRLVNKWKGWVRFRQEPALLQPWQEPATRVSDDRTA